MAKDDYFVLVYRILTCLYEFFKKGETPDTDIFDADALKINRGYWTNIMESLANEGYITGVSIVKAIGAPIGIKIHDLKITPKGIEFLQENSTIAKARGFFKTLKETIPGI